jgi:hypothetical protein
MRPKAPVQGDMHLLRVVTRRGHTPWAVPLTTGAFAYHGVALPPPSASAHVPHDLCVRSGVCGRAPIASVVWQRDEGSGDGVRWLVDESGSRSHTVSANSSVFVYMVVHQHDLLTQHPHRNTPLGPRRSTHTMHAGTPCTTPPWNATELVICSCTRRSAVAL